jgi:hypothetical protein
MVKLCPGAEVMVPVPVTVMFVPGFVLHKLTEIALLAQVHVPDPSAKVLVFVFSEVKNPTPIL